MNNPDYKSIAVKRFALPFIFFPPSDFVLIYLDTPEKT